MKGTVSIVISSGDYDSPPFMEKKITWRTAEGAENPPIESVATSEFPEAEIRYTLEKALKQLKADWEYRKND